MFVYFDPLIYLTYLLRFKKSELRDGNETVINKGKQVSNTMEHEISQLKITADEINTQIKNLTKKKDQLESILELLKKYSLSYQSDDHNLGQFKEMEEQNAKCWKQVNLISKKFTEFRTNSMIVSNLQSKNEKLEEKLDVTQSSLNDVVVHRDEILQQRENMTTLIDDLNSGLSSLYSNMMI